MRIASVADVKSKFSAYLRESERGSVIVTRNGRPVAALIAVRDDDDVEELALAHSPRLSEILEAGRSEIRVGAAIEHEEFWRRVDADDS